MTIIGSFRLDCRLKFTTETNFYNVVFNAQSENALFFEILLKVIMI